MPQRTYHVVLNARSGTVQASGITAENLAERLRRAGHVFTIDADADAPLTERIERAQASGADVIVAAGGDGTATAIAGAIVDTRQSLAILPLGTVNMLARDLGLPLDVDQWIDALATMEPRRIDVGEVNGHFFLHKVVIGFVPGLAAARERLRGRAEFMAKLGLLRFFLRRLFRARRIAVEITYGNGEKRIERVFAVAVANNDYAEGFGRFFSRQQLDGDYLSLFMLRRLTLVDVIRLAAEMGIGTWRHDEALQIVNVHSVTIRSKKSTLKVMFDGEVETLAVPLEFRIHPLALSVLAMPTEQSGGTALPFSLSGA